MKKYQLITIPDWLGGTIRDGVELAPEIIKNLIVSHFPKKYFVDKILTVPIPLPNPQHLNGKYEKVKYLPEMKQICKKTKEEIVKSMDSNTIPIILMSDDSCMMGVIAGISSKIGSNYALIWFDAHGDINTPETSPSGKICGMALAHLLGHGHSELTKLNGEKPSIMADNLILLGQRALDTGEVEFIKKHNISIYNSKQLNSKSTKEILDTMYSKFEGKNVEGLFIHLDLDVLDPVESPGVSMHESAGLHTDKLLELLGNLIKKYKNNLGLSIAEYNPHKDIEDKTKKIIQEVIKTYLKKG